MAPLHWTHIPRAMSGCNYHAVLPSAHPVTAGPPAALTLLDEIGGMARAVSEQQVAAWRAELSAGSAGMGGLGAIGRIGQIGQIGQIGPTGRAAGARGPHHRLKPGAAAHKARPAAGWAPLSPDREAALRVHVGEYLLGFNRNPQQAMLQFARAGRLAPHAGDPLHDLAAYDTAEALFLEGAYGRAEAAFTRLLAARHSPLAYDSRSCALWARHAGACAGFHAQRAKAGIPEPARLDPLCGAAALAAYLRSAGRRWDRRTVLAACRVTGRGSSLKDVTVAARRLGLDAWPITADDTGLQQLFAENGRRPIMAFAERDHFIAVTGADRNGVTYLCSDCGPWPGGQVHLTWRQWHMLEGGPYAVFCTPGSSIDRALASLHGTAAPVRVAARSLAGLKLHIGAGIGAFGSHVKLYLLYEQGVLCGGKQEGQHCNCPNNCPDDGTGTQAGTPMAGGQNPGQSYECGASYGDPVNLATGEEEYHPQPDITVYNPIGPSVTWQRLYNSLRSPTTQGYQYADFGVGFSQMYNIRVMGSGGIPGPGGPLIASGEPEYLIYPNGSRIKLTFSSTPSSTNPKVSASIGAGYAILVEWDYDTRTGGTYLRVTLPSRTVWTTTDATSTPGFNWWPLGQVTDCNGNPIDFVYTKPSSGFPLLTQINDSAGSALLTISRASNGNILSVSDRYNRSVYYQEATFSTQNVPPGHMQSYQELTHVSQIVATGTPSPPDRYAYGYTNVANGENSETVPFLTSITVPSPTGSGSSTATISYTPDSCYVSSTTDANGNTRTYSIVDSNHTKVTVTNAQQQVVYSYTAGFDNNMDKTTVTDGSNSNIIYSATYGDANDPYAPSELQDGNGYAKGDGVTGTWKYSHDQFGNTVSAETPYQTITQYNYSYTNFALGELTSFQVGSKTPVSFTYFEPSGLIKSITEAQPGTSGNPNQVVTYSFNYSALSNLLTETGPGNNATQTETATYNYTSDPAYSYSQNEALHQPLTRTDNLGHVTHFRWDQRANRSEEIDALGNEMDLTWNLANQLAAITFPAAGMTGTGRAELVNNYLYTGGPKTSTAQYNESGTQIWQESFTYGPEGEQLTRTGGTQPVTESYDGLYRVASIADGNNHASQIQYSTAGYLSQVTFPLANGQYDTISFTSFDHNGNPTSRTDGRNVTTTLSYSDPESRLTNLQYPAGANTPNVGFSYDSYGRRSGMTDGTGAYSWTFDDLDNVTTAVTTFTGLAAQTLTYGYYPDGSRESLALPGSNGSFGYDYDGAGRLTSLANPANQTWTWSYLNNNWMSNQTDDNLVNVSATRNARGFVTDLKNAAYTGGVNLPRNSGEGDKLALRVQRSY